MASYTKDKKTGKPVLQSQIETTYQPDQRAGQAAPAPDVVLPPEPKKDDDK